MSEPPPDSTPSLPAPGLAGIDAVCDRFTAAWQDGQTPRIEDYLSEAPQTDRPALLLELLHEELWHLRKRGVEPNIENYLKRFPNASDQVDQAFHPEKKQPASPAPDAAEAETSPPNTQGLDIVRVERTSSWPVFPGFRVERELGRGGMGVVYLAREQSLDRLVAIKTIRAPFASAEELHRFWQEAELVARLQHPHIVQIHHLDPTPPTPFIVLEYLPGGSLVTQLAGTPLLARDAAALGQTLARAVHHAHQQKVVHRDLKPANVLLGLDGSPKITDFGLAKNLDDVGQTSTGQILGTPSYMAPEQAEGKKTVGPPADVYALGAILYECVTTRPPFKAATSLDTIMQVVRDEPVPPRQLNARVPVDLETIILKCLQKDPARRYDSAAKLADDLGRFLVGEPIQARPVGRCERAWRSCRRNPLVAGLLALVFLLLVAGTIISTFFAVRATDQAWLATEKADEADQQRRKAVKLAGELSVALENAKAEKAKAEKLARELRVALEDVKAEKTKAEDQRERSYTDLQRRLLLPLRSRLGGPAPRKLVDEVLQSMPASRWGWECARYLAEVGLGVWPRRVLGSHDWGVTAMLASADGKLLLSSGEDGRLLAWDTAGGTVRTLQPGRWSAPDGVWWPISRGKLPREGEEVVVALAWLEPGKSVVGATLTGRVMLWQIDGKAPARELCRFGQDQRVTCLAVSPDRRLIAVGDDRGTLQVVAPNGALVRQLSLASSPLVGVVARAGGQGWIVAQQNGALHHVDTALNKVLGTAREPGAIWDLDLDPAGEVVAVAGSRLALYRIGPGSRLDLTNLFGPAATSTRATSFHRVRFSPNGRSLYLGDDQGGLTVWQRSGEQVFTRHLVMSRQAHTLPADCPLPLRRRIRALLPTADGRSLFIGGTDTLLTEWFLEPSTGRSEFRIPGLTAVCFDPVSPALLWAGCRDGQVHLIDSRKGEILTCQRLHQGAVVAIECAPGHGQVVTAGADGKLCNVQRRGLRFTRQGKDIQHDHPLRALAVHVRQDGERLVRRLAATDSADQAIVWDGTTGRRLAARSLRAVSARETAASGRLAYNADGSLLGVCGPGPRFWLFEGDHLRVLPEQPNVVNGQGGTAVRWHPRHSRIVATGDTTGRVHIPPDLAIDPSWPVLVSEGYEARSNRPVCGLAWTPTGDRLAAVTSHDVLVFEPRRIGLVWKDRLSHPEAFQVAFDPTGQRLLVAHRDGNITVRETGFDRLTVPGAAQPDTHYAWKDTALLAGDQAQGLLEPRAMFDSEGRLGILYSHLEQSGEKAGARERVFRVGVWDGRRFDPGAVVVRMPDNETARQVAYRNCTVSVRGRDFFAAYRRPGSGNTAVPIWCNPRRGQEWIVGPSANRWCDLHAIPASDGTVSLTDYCHETFRLQLTRARIVGDKWTTGPTASLGHFGDGYLHQTVPGHDGRLHIAFAPQFNNRVRRTLTYLCCTPGDPDKVMRETVSEAYLAATMALAVGPDGEPAILHSRIAEQGHLELVLSRRLKKVGQGKPAWKQSVVLDRLPGNWVHGPKMAISGLVCDDTGCYHALLNHEYQRRLLWLSGREGEGWHVQTLIRQSMADEERQWNVQARLLLDQQGNLAVVLAEITTSGARLRLFTRPKPG